MDLFTQLSMWAAPPLLGIVTWFVIKTYGDIEGSIKDVKKDIEKDRLDRQVDLDKVFENFSKVREHLHAHNNNLAKYVGKIDMIKERQEDLIKDLSKRNDKPEELYGKVIHIEATVSRHEQILISSAKIMRNQNDRILKSEAEIVDLKTKKTK